VNFNSINQLVWLARGLHYPECAAGIVPATP